MECPVCFEVFDTPLLLPGCGHTLCRSCAACILTPNNFLTCPECRLVHQLARGLQSLPKNVALERSIDEHKKSLSRLNLNQMCEEHPDDAVTLFCKTCDKSICLKCYFSNTIRGRSVHSGHQVDTTEDAFGRERRLLEAKCKFLIERQSDEGEYLGKLEETKETLAKMLEEKLADVEKNKNDVLTKVKQTSGKLKFTLKGSAARENEYLDMALEKTRERIKQLDAIIQDTKTVLERPRNEVELDEVKVMKDAARKIDDDAPLSDTERPRTETFLKIGNFDTSIMCCLSDPKRALSYQTESPRMPEILVDKCVVSSETVYLVIKYNEQVRVQRLTIYLKEAMYKGFSEKQYDTVDLQQMSQGLGTIVLESLQRGTMYRVYAVASNDFGDSPPSKEVWFRTVQEDIEIRTM